MLSGSVPYLTSMPSSSRIRSNRDSASPVKGSCERSTTRSCFTKTRLGTLLRFRKRADVPGALSVAAPRWPRCGRAGPALVIQGPRVRYSGLSFLKRSPLLSVSCTTWRSRSPGGLSYSPSDRKQIHPHATPRIVPSPPVWVPGGARIPIDRPRRSGDTRSGGCMSIADSVDASQPVAPLGRLGPSVPWPGWWIA